ncbi:MAG: hypothetical protein QMD82_03760 [bacterium]|nr:hypothetical protein [bacterium]
MLLRKALHLSTIILLSFLKYLHTHGDKKAGLILMLSLSAIAILLEIARNMIPSLKNLFLKIFSPLLKEEEKAGKVTGASFLIISMTLSYAIFDFEYFYYASLIAILVDGLTPLITLLLFRKNNKDHHHLITFLISAIIVAFIVNSGLPLIVKLTTSVIVSLIEYINPPPDDNFYAEFLGTFIIYLLAKLFS